MTEDALEEGGSAPPSKVRGFSFLPLSFCPFFFFLVLLFSSGPSLGLASSSIISSYAALSARSLALRSSFATATRRFSSSSLCTLVVPWWYAGIGREFAAAGFPLRLAAGVREESAEQPTTTSLEAGQGTCGLRRAPLSPRFCIASVSEDPAPGPVFAPRKKAAGRARPSASLKSPTPLTGLELSPLVWPGFSPCSIELTRCATAQRRRNCC